jgi:DNA-binding CsgD family transcriptional regulator
MRGTVAQMLGDVRSRPGLLNNKNGKTIDMLRRDAQEAGFDVRDDDEFIRLLGDELQGGQKTYRIGEAEVWNAYQEYLRGPIRGAGWTGTRPRGFNDDLERGTDAFSDPRLNADQNKIAEMAKNGYSNAEIGEEMGKLPQTVAVRISQLRRKGIDIPAGRAIRPVTPERVQMEKLINEGLSNAQIAKRTGKSSAHVGVIRNRLKTTGPAHAGFEGAKGDLASGAVGSSYGYTQGDTPEEKNANAAMGFVSGIAAKRAGGAGVRRGSAMTNALAPKGPVRGAGFSGNTPKPGSGRLGRGLNDLLNEPGPARPARPDDLPRRTVEPPAQGRPDPTLSRERTSKDDKAFYDSLSAPERDHARAVGPIGKMGKEPPPPGFVVTASLLTALGGAGGVSAYLGSIPVEPNFAQNRSKVMSELAKAPDSATWQNRARQFDAFVKSDTARQTDLEGVDKRLLNARRKAVREASDAFATAGDRAELTAAIDRVEALDYAIDVSLGNAEPFDEAPPMARPPSLKPVPNALAGPPPMTRNSQGQFVRPMTNRERQEAAR